MESSTACTTPLVVNNNNNNNNNNKKRTIRAILFDMDGTLLDTETVSDRAVLHAFGESLPSHIPERLGHRLPWEIKEPTLGLPGNEWIPLVIRYAQQHWGVGGGSSSASSSLDTEHASDDGGSRPPAPSVSEFWETWESTLNSYGPNIQACPGATELVEALAAASNLRLAIATSSRAVAVAAKRQKHDRIFRHMEVIVTGDDPAVRERGKPHPAIYLEAARRLGVDPTECLVVEDAVAGAQSGRAAGCVVVAVPDARMEDGSSRFADCTDEVLDSLWSFDGRPWGIHVNMPQLLQQQQQRQRQHEAVTATTTSNNNTNET